jgi:hypothetical protein
MPAARALLIIIVRAAPFVPTSPWLDPFGRLNSVVGKEKVAATKSE